MDSFDNLLRELKETSTLKRIQIPYGLEHAQLKKLLFFLSRSKNVVSIFFAGTQVDDEMKLDEIDIKALSNELKKNSSLQAFRVSSHKLPAAAAAVAEALRVNSTLQLLYLDGNEIGDLGIKSIAESIKMNSSSVLNTLNLRNNNVGVLGARILAQTLIKNTTLENIDLSSNQIGDSGAKYLAKAIKKSTTVRNLQLRNNDIGVTGGCAMAEMLKVNKRLYELNLNENQLGDAATSLSNAMKYNKTIKALRLENCGLTSKQKGKFIRTLRVVFQEPEKGIGFTLTNLENHGFISPHTKVFTLQRNGAAERAGVWVGDKVLKINKTLITESMNFEECVDLIKKAKRDGKLHITFQKMDKRRLRVKLG